MLLDGLLYLPSEVFGVVFHRPTITRGSSVLIRAVGQGRGMDYLLTAYSPVAKGRVLNDATL